MRAHVFDMDGTLLVDTTALLLLAQALGELESFAHAGRALRGGTASAVEFARAL
jgi:hypothetical protein